MLKVRETDDLSGLLEMFKKNGLEVSDRSPENGALVKCWEINDDNSGQRIAGLQLEKRGDEFIIVGISVDSRNRKSGLGKMLVNKAVEEVKSLGGKRILLVAKVPEFFKKSGFEVIDAPELGKLINCGGCEQLNKSCFPAVMCLNV